MNLKQAFAILIVGAVVGGGVSAGILLSPLAKDDERIEQIVDKRLAALPSVETPIEEEELGPLIEQYLVANPSVLERVSAALTAEREAEQRAKTKSLISARKDEIFGSDDAVVVGNPDGDVTLVEFYDYNCEYCKRAVPEVAALLAEDPNVRVVLRQFPILSEGSLEAARVGVVVALQGGDYWAFHNSMFTARGQSNLSKALAQASAIGLTEESVRSGLSAPEVTEVITASASLARDLGINGTPSFILADEIIPGAVGVEVLREKIENVRSCGSTRCIGE